MRLMAGLCLRVKDVGFDRQVIVVRPAMDNKASAVIRFSNVIGQSPV